jgi:hypothetical protein
MTSDDWAAAAAEGFFDGFATQAATDANGYAWLDQYGRPMTMTGLVESSAGQRLTREDPFEGLGRPP